MRMIENIDFIEHKTRRKERNSMCKISISALVRTNQDLVYQQMRNFDHLSMPNKQYVNDKNQVEKLMIQQELMAMYDLYTNKKK
jgi:hypothetical protein